MSTGSAKPRKRKQTPKPDDPAQSARFIEAARELGIDESGAAFERAVDSLLPKKPAGKKKGA